MYTLPIDQHATVLVTGASGFVGRALLHGLNPLGCRIKILARSESAVDNLHSTDRIELHQGDILSKTEVHEACKGVTHIFHLAGRGQNNRQRDQTDRVNVEGTKILAQAAVRESQVERFVHVSTIGVHGNILRGPATEAAAFAAQSRYEISKLTAETWLKDFATQAQLPTTILRPCAIIGPGDMRLLKLFKLGRRRFIPLPGGGTNRYQIIHVEDCVRVMLAAAQKEIAVGEAYICGNAETLALRELLEIIHCSAQTNKSRPSIVSLPLRPTRAILEVIEKLCSVIGVTTPVAAQRLAFFEQSHWFDTTKMREDLGVELHYDNVSALRATRDWYAANLLL